jgi:methylenetetrahydrofolate--tRNA-(uracil-5-)-methyltransferase
MTTRTPDVVIVGAGLAGCEAALILAERGFRVRLYERKPLARSEASSSDLFAELVCSNSLRARQVQNAVGLLKEEMRRLGSYVMRAADACEVPAGGALAVDRERFSGLLTGQVRGHKNIEVVAQQVEDFPAEGRIVVIATGPLTGDALAERIAQETGREQLHFYDAIAPIIDAESIDYDIAFFASRYGKGGDDYLNLPLNRDEYEHFVTEILAAEKVTPREFEDPRYFEGCLPIDIMAERGERTLAFGPMKPVGLSDPRSGRRPYAVVQLRPENKDRTAFSLVGFQTRMTYGEQQRVFRQLPGLAQAEFLRLGNVHRNTFVDAPQVLDNLRLKNNPRIVFAGQLAGVEGYVESAACGLWAGLSIAAELMDRELPLPPETTAHGALMRYLATPAKDFQPSNVIWAMVPALDNAPRGKKDRKQALADRGLADLDEWMAQNLHLLMARLG